MLQVQLRVEGRTCLVVGGGTVGTRRAKALLDAGAKVVVVDPSPSPALEELASTGRVELKLRTFSDTDIDTGIDADTEAEVADIETDIGAEVDDESEVDPESEVDDESDLNGEAAAGVGRPVDAGDNRSRGIALVVAATDDKAVNETVGAAARRAGIMVNRADDAASGDLSFPAVVRRGPIAIGVSTGTGVSAGTGTADAVPALARWVAQRLDEGVDQLLGLDEAALAQFAELLAEVREQLRAKGDQTHGYGSAQSVETAGSSARSPLDWHLAFDGSILDLVRTGRLVEAKERILACL